METTFSSTSENGKKNYRNLQNRTVLRAQCCGKGSLEDYDRVITLCNSFSLCCFALRMLYGLLSSQLPEHTTLRRLSHPHQTVLGYPATKGLKDEVC